MNIEHNIKRYEQRPGFRLADAAEVGLPAYKLNVDAVTLAHKRLPPIEEFLLRCIGMQVSVASEMSGFLGISEEVITPALSSLVQTENIALTAMSGRQSWVLTTKGRTTLETAEFVLPEERTFQIQFDAILRKPALFRPHQLLEFKELRNEGLFEIEVYPPKRPVLAEISPADLERLLKNLPSGKEKRRDILAVRSLDPRSIKKQYVRATALLFRGLEADETQLGFIIDGKLSREHENRFSGSEGFSRTVQNIARPGPLEREEIQAAAASASIPTLVRSMQARVQSSARAAEARVVELAADMERADAIQNQELIVKLEAAEVELAKLRSEEMQFAVKYLYVTDHPPLLQDAISNAKERLMIISPWITAAVVDTVFLTRMEGLLLKNVQIYIGYGISENETQKLKQCDIDARNHLRALSARYPSLAIKRLGNTHAKVLIKDSEYAAVTSFNWLSFKGDPSQKFRDEQGVLLRRPALVDEKFKAQLTGFTSGPSLP